MSKKSFKDLSNPALQFITQDTQGTQDTLSTPDTPPTQTEHQAQRKRSQKLPRINMAFQESNLEYLQIMSRIEGVSITKYVNGLIEQDRSLRAELYDKGKELFKQPEDKRGK